MYPPIANSAMLAYKCDVCILLPPTLLAMQGSVYDSSFANSLLELPSNVAAAVMVELVWWCVWLRVCS